MVHSIISYRLTIVLVPMVLKMMPVELIFQYENIDLQKKNFHQIDFRPKSSINWWKYTKICPITFWNHLHFNPTIELWILVKFPRRLQRWVRPETRPNRYKLLDKFSPDFPWRRLGVAPWKSREVTRIVTDDQQSIITSIQSLVRPNYHHLGTAWWGIRWGSN